MEGHSNIKKIFLIVMVVALSISAFIGIFIFLIGDFGEIEGKILLTTLSLGVFSLTAMSSAILYDKHKLTSFSIIGMIVALLGFLMATSAIWEIVDYSNSHFFRMLIISVIISFSIAQSSLLLLINSEDSEFNISLTLTLINISIVSLMLIHLVLIDFEINSSSYYRVLGAFAILDVLGTITTPIISKIKSMKKLTDSTKAIN